MAQRNLSYKGFLTPNYWLVWLALGLAKLLASLPLRMQHRIGSGIGYLAYKALKNRRRICEINIATCFPQLSLEDRDQLVRRVFESNGIGILEAFRSWFSNPESIKSSVQYNGSKHLEAALEKGKGVILLGAHYSTLDLAGSLTTLFFKADVMQRDHSNGLFNAVMTRSRQALYGKVLDKKDLRGLIQSLRDNHVVWYATDQDYGRKVSVFAPFFGVQCATLTTTMRLAAKTGAAVVPFSHFRTEAGCYELNLFPALEEFPSGSVDADAARLNLIIEEQLRAHPEQYLWMHRRFKTALEEGAVNIYGQVRG
jgi:KDO2-lipid IV(A) lauroyltransferase